MMRLITGSKGVKKGMLSVVPYDCREFEIGKRKSSTRAVGVDPMSAALAAAVCELSSLIAQGARFLI